MIQYLKHKKWRKIIAQSGLFDTQYYLFTYPDVRKADIDPIMHYIKHGAAEGRNPNRDFDTKFYLNSYDDVRKSGLNPLVHYVLYGRGEGRNNMALKENKSIFKNKTAKEKKSFELHDKKLKNKFEHDVITDFYEDKILFNYEGEIKPIAFYLPQFHEVKENNLWWEKGFTDWTSCKYASKWYDDHFQTRIPHPDMGYYNLLNTNTLHKQARLAKEYGIFGFCFYYYWFSGKMILEKPLELFLSDKSININFCLCWANENWSRRWDGSDHEILMEQKYKNGEDVEFIKNISKYLKDSRYIRYEGKPMLLIYRKQQLPDAVAMTKAWREWCRENGIGEIYLVAVQTYQDYSNPTKFGFDAAVEMPAHLQNKEYNTKCNNIKTYYGFNGVIDSYRDYYFSVANKRKRHKGDYTIFKNAILKFDNAGRKRDKSHIFTNFSFDIFQKWTIDNIYYARKELPINSRFIFFNAWNEWAEGTYLEPDTKYGYAALNSIGRALKEVEPLNFRKNKNTKYEASRILLLDTPYDRADQLYVKPKSIAVHAHVFYIDWLDELIGYLNNIDYVFDLFITCIDTEVKREANRKVAKLLKVDKLHIEIVQNRGRDIAPFFVTLKEKIVNYDLVCHVHSKKSFDNWRLYLLDRIMGLGVNRIINELSNDESVGIIHPQTYPEFVSLENSGSNKKHMTDILDRCGYHVLDIDNIRFPAGTFFWAKVDAIKPLLNTGYTIADFPSEPLPNDGTLAHGIERVIDIVVSKQKYKSIFTLLKDDVIQFPKKSLSERNSFMQTTAYTEISFYKKINETKNNIVYFDIFDTLLTRPFYEPEELFNYMLPRVEAIVGKKINNFTNQRIYADTYARSKIKNKDIDISDIYRSLEKLLGITSSQANRIKALEIGCELSMARPREVALDMLKFAKTKKLKIVLLSDMYLTKDVIKKMLNKVGISDLMYDELLVSSFTGMRKDSGSVYKYLLEKERSKKHFVIGDSLHSDVVVPLKNGFTSFHLPSKSDLIKRLFVKNNLSMLSFPLKENEISPAGLIAERLFCKTISFQENLFSNQKDIGYICFGPLLYQFIKKSHEIAVEMNIEKLLFLTREGVVFKKVYDLMKPRLKNPIDSSLLYASRVMSNSLQSGRPDFIDQIIDSNLYFDGRIDEFFYGRLGYQLTDTDNKKLKSLQINLNTKYCLPKDRNLIVRVFKTLESSILKTLNMQKKIFLNYLSHVVVEKSAVLDIGYSGTVQKNINSMISAKTFGLYIMSKSGHNDTDKTCMFNQYLGGSDRLKEVFLKYSIYYEALLTSSTPPIIAMDENEGGFKPRYMNCTYSSKYLELLNNVHDGILEFISDVINRFDELPDFNFESTLWTFKDFLDNPNSLSDIRLLLDLEMDDLYTGNNMLKFFDDPRFFQNLKFALESKNEN